MKAKVTGTVIEVKPWTDIDCRSGKKLSKFEITVDDSQNPKYPNPLPFVCWDRATLEGCSDVGVGDTVEVEFYLKSRRSSDGKRLYLNLNIASMKITERCAASGVVSEGAEEEPFADAEDDEDLPF